MRTKKLFPIVIALAFLIAPLAALPLPAQGWQLHPKIDLSRAHASFWGENANEYVGSSVADDGDVNGDGYDDVLVGASMNSDGGRSYNGQVYLFFGKPSGWSRDIDLSKADASFRGEHSYDEAGMSVAFAGDVNGDGYDDILIAAPYDADAHSYAGQVYLVLGKVSGWAMDTDLSSASASFLGESASDYAGYSVDGAGDVNGDGYDDIIIGAPLNSDGGSTNRGQSYLIYGKSSGWAMDTDLSTASASFWGEASGDCAGYSVAGAGDVNRDGYADFLIGAPYNNEAHFSAGQSYLVLGRSSGLGMDTGLGGVSASFYGENAGDDSGVSVSGAGDVNGDRYDDILVGAYYNSEAHGSAGQTYLILGKATGWALNTDLSASSASFWGEEAVDLSGIRSAGAGDVNRDGYDDFLISAPYNSKAHTYAGQIYLILGKATGWAMDRDLSTAEASFLGEIAYDYAGYYQALAGGGDVNGDGYCDFLIGSADNDEAHNSAGQAYLIMPYSRPPAPTNLKAQLSTTGKSINLTWDAASGWNEPVTGYHVFRSTDGGYFNDTAFRGPTDRTFSDVNVTMGRTYYYVVTTVDGDGMLSDRSAMLSLVCDKDTDQDGIGDMSDPFTWTNLRFLNNTLSGVWTTLNDTRTLTNSLNGNVTTLTNNINTVGTNLQTMITQVDTDLAAVNASLQGRITGMSATLRSDISGLNGSLATGLDGVRFMINGVSDDVTLMNLEMRSTLSGMNRSLAKNMSDMESRLKADITALDTALDAVNASLHSELAGLDKDIADFQKEMETSLAAVLAHLDASDANQTKNAKDIQTMIANLNSTSLANMKQMLTELQTRTDALDTDLTAKVADFRSSTNSRFDNISRVMSTIDDIKTLTGEVKTVQTQVKGVKAEQDTTSKNVSALGTPSWLSVLMMIVVLVLALVLLMMSRGKKGEPPTTEVAPEPERPLPPPPPPMPPMRAEHSPPPRPPMRSVPPPEGGMHP